MEDTKKVSAKAKLVFTSRLTPKKAAEGEADDRGIPISSELQARLPVVVAAGRTPPPIGGGPGGPGGPIFIP